MKLAALGLVTAGLGLVLSIPGLLGIGAWWIVLGLLARQHAAKLTELQPTTPGGKPAIDGRTFAVGTALFLALGIPSLAVGILQLGIDGQHEAWRWLPIGVGALALGIGVLSTVLYLAGSAVSAAAGEPPTIPATIRIRSVKETGTYINERPRLEFELTVEPDAASGIAPYDVTKKATVPFTAMGSLKVGDGFQATVAGPDEPTSMEISWDQPVAGAGPSDADVSARLDELDRLRREGKVTDEEYAAQRNRILGSI